MKWIYDPHSGGIKIPASVQERTRQRLIAYANQNYAGKFNRIDVRFRNQFCYFDAYTEPTDSDQAPFGESREAYLDRIRNTPLHLGRLRYFGNEERWSLAFYTYSHEKYEPSCFDNGTFEGSPEEGFATCAIYLV